jgi:hypothetical protein
MHLKTLGAPKHNASGGWDIGFFDDFAAEFRDYPKPVQDELLAILIKLRQFGPQLGRPDADTLKGSRYSNMNELRFNTADEVWRVPRLKAILLVGGNKSGVSERRFYKRLILVADERFGRHLATIASEGKWGMTVSLEEILAEMPAERRERIEQRAAQLIAEELTLREVRRARKLTQARLSKKLKIGQEGVSRIEKRTDLYLSTLRSYVEGVGGKLSLIVEFPDRPPILLAGLGENATSDQDEKKAKKKSKGEAKSKSRTGRAA